MQNEYAVLKYIKDNHQTSQRKIAENTGLSVGTVNLLIKKMVREGLIKLERINGRTLHYILTPKGIAEKTKLTYAYLKISYQQIIRIKKALERISTKYKPDLLVFYGSQDEVFEILKTVAADKKMRYIVVNKEKKLEDEIAKIQKDILPLVVTWDLDMDERLSKCSLNITNVNILEEI